MQRRVSRSACPPVFRIIPPARTCRRGYLIQTISFHRTLSRLLLSSFTVRGGDTQCSITITYYYRYDQIMTDDTNTSNDTTLNRKYSQPN